jgi:hypothetical protein
MAESIVDADVVPANFPRPLLSAGVRRCRRKPVTRGFRPPLCEGSRNGCSYKADVGGSSPSAPTPLSLLGLVVVGGVGEPPQVLCRSHTEQDNEILRRAIRSLGRTSDGTGAPGPVP